MSDSLDRLARLKRDIARHRREADKTEGALEQILRRLKAEHGCETLEEAEALAVKLKKQTVRARKEFERQLATFERRFAKFLRAGKR